MKNLERVFLIGLGAMALGTEKALVVAKEMGKKGEVYQGRTKDVLETLEQKGAAEKNKLGEMALSKSDELLKGLPFAKSDEVKALEVRVAALERALQAQGFEEQGHA